MCVRNVHHHTRANAMTIYRNPYERIMMIMMRLAAGNVPTGFKPNGDELNKPSMISHRVEGSEKLSTALTATSIPLGRTKIAHLTSYAAAS